MTRIRGVKKLMTMAMTAAMRRAEDEHIDFNEPGVWEQVYEQVMEGAR